MESATALMPPSIGFNDSLVSAETQNSGRTTICKQVNTLSMHGDIMEGPQYVNTSTVYQCTGKSSTGYKDNCCKIQNSEYDQEIPQSQTADIPMAPRGRATQQSRDIRKTNKAKQPALSSPIKMIAKLVHKVMHN